jgi:hypothetical protein
MKKIIIISLIATVFCVRLMGQCSNPYAGEDFDVCGVTTNLSVQNATTGYWTALHDGIPLLDEFTPNTSLTDIVVTIRAFSEPYKTYQFVWHDDSGPCSDTVNVTFAIMPVASVGFTQLAEICGTDLVFNADTLGNGWAEFEWSSPLLPATFSDASLPDSEVSISPDAFGDSAHVSMDFVWTATNLSCISTDTMYVSFYQRPDAFAGLDDAVCGNEYILQAELSIPESANYTPLMQWGIAGHPSGESANISSINTTQPNLTVSSDGLWQVTFTERNSLLSSCYSRDTAIIEFVEIPIVNAGQDFSVCGYCVELGSFNDGYWTSDCIGFTDYGELVCVGGYGVCTFEYHEVNSAYHSSLTCEGTDLIDITFWRQPTAQILSEESDSVVCGLQFNNLIAEDSGNGITGFWYNNNPATLYGDALSNSTWVEVPNDGYYNFYWIEDSGPLLMPGFCSDTAGPLRIHFLNSEPLFAGNDMSIVGYTFPLSANSDIDDPYSECTYLWENVNAVFLDSSSLQTLAYVTAFGQYDFILTSSYDNLNSCVDSDTVRITFTNSSQQGIDSEDNVSLEIFPNPTNGIISIDSEYTIDYIVITDLNGRQILQIESPFSEIDISALEQGVYFIKISTAEGAWTTKIVKQ